MHDSPPLQDSEPVRRGGREVARVKARPQAMPPGPFAGASAGLRQSPRSRQERTVPYLLVGSRTLSTTSWTMAFASGLAICICSWRGPLVPPALGPSNSRAFRCGRRAVAAVAARSQPRTGAPRRPPLRLPAGARPGRQREPRAVASRRQRRRSLPLLHQAVVQKHRRLHVARRVRGR